MEAVFSRSILLEGINTTIFLPYMLEQLENCVVSLAVYGYMLFLNDLLLLVKKLSWSTKHVFQCSEGDSQ